MQWQVRLLGSPEREGRAFFSHALLLLSGMEMRWLLDLGAKITQKRKMHKALRGWKEAGSLKPAKVPNTSPGPPTSGILREKEINSYLICFEISYS